MLALVLLFIVVPLVELYVIVKVAGSIGIVETLVALIAISMIGAWLVRRQGLAALGRLQQQLASGHLPTRELVDGVIILVGGALLLTPGFVTDAVGLMLLVPPVRAVLRGSLLRRFGRRPPRSGRRPGGRGPIFDVSSRRADGTRSRWRSPGGPGDALGGGNSPAP